MRHTPGPWRIDHHIQSGVCSVVWDYEYKGEKYPYSIAGSVGFGRYPEGNFDVGMAQREANACLIAAAPDLLKACQVARDEMRDPSILTAELISILQGAIDKAVSS